MANNKTPTRYVAPKTDEDKARARDLFFSYTTTAAIGKQLGVTQATIAKWRDDGEWVAARKNNDLEIVEDTFSAKRVALARIMGVTTTQIERGLKVIADRFEPPTLKETEILTNIVANLDKISRLDSGKSTENVSVAIGGNIGLTVDRIKEMIINEPFFPKAAPVVPDA